MIKIEGSGSISQRHGSADPDTHQNVMDPQHCLKSLQIRAQGSNPGLTPGGGTLSCAIITDEKDVPSHPQIKKISKETKRTIKGVSTCEALNVLVYEGGEHLGLQEGGEEGEVGLHLLRQEGNLN
jgi:hypothetical protein